MDVELSQKKKKKKRKHKHKKHVKESSDSDGDSSAEEWIEQNPTPKQETWMQEDFLSGIQTVSSKDVKEQKKRLKEESASSNVKALHSIDQTGLHKKELNPFWKCGGTGLPSELDTAKKTERVPDLSWLQSSLRRMQEQNKETGRSLEAIAAERYGSWKAFESLLKRAEEKAGKLDSSKRKHHDSHSRSSGRRFLKPSDDHSSASDRHSSKRHRSETSHKSSRSQAWKRPVEHTDHHQNEVASRDRPHQDSAISKKESHSVESNLKQPMSHSFASATEQNKVHSPNENKTNVETSSSAGLEEEGKILSEQEKNTIAAKIIKAELMGKNKLLQKLQKKLQLSKELEAAMKNNNAVEQPRKDIRKPAKMKKNSSSGSDSEDGETVVLTRTTKSGQVWPLTETEMPLSAKTAKRLKNKKVKVHNEDGERERYFADDDSYTLKELVERERSGAAEEQTETLSRLSSKLFTKTDGDNFTLDDMFESQAGKVNCRAQEESRNRQKAIGAHRKLMRRLEKCKFCFGNSENPQHLIIAVGKTSYLKLPSHRVLQPGHCIIAPMHHCATGTSLDENVWDEIKKFMRALCDMYKERGDDCVFLQTCMGLKYSPHFFIECVPLPKEVGDLGPIYFKKAIQECESEWAQNKALVDTRGKNVKDKIPSGLPYFAVDFGLDGGFAHVIEDEQSFPDYFGREILGGMLCAEPQLWRKPKEEEFSDQTKRTLEFEKWFKDFDWTSN